MGITKHRWLSEQHCYILLSENVLQFSSAPAIQRACSVFMLEVRALYMFHYYYNSAQGGIYAPGKAHMRSTPSLKSFPNVAFETVPMFTCLTSTALSRHFGTGKTYRVIAVWPKSLSHKHEHSLCRFQVFLYHAPDCSCGYSTCSLKVNKK